MIDELVEEYLKEKKKKEKTPLDKVRKPTAPPTKKFKDKSKYDRKKEKKVDY